MARTKAETTTARGRKLRRNRWRTAEHASSEERSSSLDTESAKHDEDIIDAPADTSGDTESGWASIARSVRDIDEQKVKDYKEDIDTILVFAGLFSAVLSALLIESLQSLQPDPNTVTISLLAQIASQTRSYVISSQYLNSTAEPLDLASIQGFKPTITAQRINVLWCTSLMLSLMSASFAILVKQWLREYLAGEYISPQAQLRIRHFRTPGLEHWRVYAIAAMLPIMLQLALALFFVGLCFFTLDIHSSIGYTTIPLVAGWALLFIAATFAPALSPRCPYKVPIFKPSMQFLRAALFRIIRVFKRPPVSGSKADWPMLPHWSWWSLAYEEKDAVEDPREDVNILVSVDATQTDDQLVMKMCQALKEAHISPELMIDFVLKIIGSRLQMSLHAEYLPLLLDFSRLPIQTCTILMDAIANVLAQETERFPPSEPIIWTDLMLNCLFLLTARLPCYLSDKATQVVASCFAGTQTVRCDETLEMLFMRADLHMGYRLCLHLQQRLRGAFLHLNPWQFLDTMFLMMKKSCCSCGECLTIESVLDHAEVPLVLKQHLCELMTGYMLHQVQTEAIWNEWHREIMIILFKKRNERGGSSWHSALHELVRHLVRHPQYARHVYRHLFHKNDYQDVAEGVFILTFSSSPDKHQILINLHDALTSYLTEMTKTTDLLDADFYLRLLWFIDGQHQPMLDCLQSKVLAKALYCPLYQTMWKAVHGALSRFDPATLTAEQTERAEACLQNIDDLDEAWHPVAGADADFEEWTTAFNPGKSFFGDDFIEDLMKFLPDVEAASCKRVRRVLWRRERQKQKARVKSFNGTKDGIHHDQSTVGGTMECEYGRDEVLHELLQADVTRDVS